MSSDSLLSSLPEDLVRRLFTALPDKSSKQAFSATARHIRLAILPELTVTLKVTAEQLQNSCAAENPLLNFPRGATLKALVIKASGSGPSPLEFWLRELLEQGHDERGSRIKATLQNVSSLTVLDSSAPMKNGLRCILYAHLPNLRELRLERGPASMGSGRNAHTHYLSFLDFVATNESGQPLELLVVDTKEVDHRLINTISCIRTLRNLCLTARFFDDLTPLSELPLLKDLTLSHLKQCPRAWPASLCNLVSNGFMRPKTLEGIAAAAAAAGYLPKLTYLFVGTLDLEFASESDAGRAYYEGSSLAAPLASVPSLAVQIGSVNYNGMNGSEHSCAPLFCFLRPLGTNVTSRINHLTMVQCKVDAGVMMQVATVLPNLKSLSMMVCLHDVRLESLQTVVRGFCNLRILYVSFDYISQPGFAAKMLPICAEAQLYQDHPIQIRLEADSPVGAGDEIHMHIAAELEGLEVAWDQSTDVSCQRPLQGRPAHL